MKKYPYNSGRIDIFGDEIWLFTPEAENDPDYSITYANLEEFYRAHPEKRNKKPTNTMKTGGQIKKVATGNGFDYYQLEKNGNTLYKLVPEGSPEPTSGYHSKTAALEKAGSPYNLYDYAPLREVRVTYSDGSSITTPMASHLTDEDIHDYFKVGREFNLGSGENDKMAKVKSVEILKATGGYAGGGKSEKSYIDTIIDNHKETIADYEKKLKVARDKKEPESVIRGIIKNIDVHRELLADAEKRKRLSGWSGKTGEDFELGTPVVFRDVSGEVIIRDGKRAISLYPDKNYAGHEERIVFPTLQDWNKIKTFREANQSMDAGGTITKVKVKTPSHPEGIYATLERELPQTVVTNEGIFPKENVVGEFQVEKKHFMKDGGRISKQDVVDQVLEQMKKNVDSGDITVEEELFMTLPKDVLIESFPEDEWDKYRSKSKEDVVDAVLDNMKNNIKTGDVTVEEELLNMIPEEKLIASLPEENRKALGGILLAGVVGTAIGAAAGYGYRDNITTAREEAQKKAIKNKQEALAELNKRLAKAKAFKENLKGKAIHQIQRLEGGGGIASEMFPEDAKLIKEKIPVMKKKLQEEINDLEAALDGALTSDDLKETIRATIEKKKEKLARIEGYEREEAEREKERKLRTQSLAQKSIYLDIDKQFKGSMRSALHEAGIPYNSKTEGDTFRIFLSNQHQLDIATNLYNERRAKHDMEPVSKEEVSNIAKARVSKSRFVPVKSKPNVKAKLVVEKKKVVKPSVVKARGLSKSNLESEE